MSAEHDDLNNNDFNWTDNRSVLGEWLKMVFPVGCLPIYDGEDVDDSLYLEVEFAEGKTFFNVKKAMGENGFRSPNDYTIYWFEMPVDLLNRISRVARS